MAKTAAHASNNLTAEVRTKTGKGASRQARRDGKVPAVLYGHGAEPVHVALPGHATMLALKHSNALISFRSRSDSPATTT